MADRKHLYTNYPNLKTGFDVIFRILDDYVEVDNFVVGDYASEYMNETNVVEVCFALQYMVQEEFLERVWTVRHPNGKLVSERYDSVENIPPEYDQYDLVSIFKRK